MEFLWAFAVTGLAATGGWLVWGLGHKAQLREQELADQAYQDFTRRHPKG